MDPKKHFDTRTRETLCSSPAGAQCDHSVTPGAVAPQACPAAADHGTAARACSSLSARLCTVAELWELGTGCLDSAQRVWALSNLCGEQPIHFFIHEIH